MKGKTLKALIVSLVAAMLIFIPVMAAPQTAEAATISPQVTYHTQAEIIKYYKDKGIDFNAPISYKTTPKKYSTVGTLDDKTSKKALSNLNYIRYIAGINSNVILSSEYTEKAQYSAFINDLNGDIDHYPDKPTGVSETIYQKGHDASDECSLSGWNNVNYALIRWMNELGNRSNLYPLGHRMHIIDPTLKQTGFGNSSLVGGASTMYTSGTRNYSASEKYVVWPAQQMPIDIWGTSPNSMTKKWSVSTFDKKYDASKIKIKITNGNKVWNISKSNTSQGTLSVEEFGFINYIMFEPKDLTPQNGDVYNVEISNLGTDTLKYSVEFFDINDPGDIEIITENGIKKTYKGGVFRKYTGLAKDTDGIWYYFTNGVHDNKYIGASPSTENEDKYYFVKNGVWDRSYTGLAKYYKDGNWYYMTNGSWDKKYLGASPSTQNPDKYYFVKNGIWDRSYTGLAKYYKDGIWYYMTNGSWDKTYIGATPSTENPDKLYFAKNGKWDTSYTGLAKYYKDGNWYYMKTGRFDKTFTGLSPSTAFPNNKYYVKGGLWQNTFSGKITFNNKTYNIKTGRAL